MSQLTPRITTRLVAPIFLALGLLLIGTMATAQPIPPDGWLDGNINGGTGGWSYNDEGFTVTGSGTDIWGTADSFHFAYQVLDGDGVFRARVRSIHGTQEWTKVGLMIRESLDPGSPHHFLLASLAKGLAYQRRLTAGATSLNTPLPSSATAIWYRIVRTGGQVQLGMSEDEDGVNWNTIATVSWPTGPTYIGFAVTSHDASTTATAFGRFDNVALTGNQRSAPFVSVISPQPGAVVQTTSPHTIQWQAGSTDGDRLENFKVYLGFEQGGAITYQPLAGCTFLPADARQCTWSSPGPASDAAHILVVATDAFTDEGSGESGRFQIDSPQTGSLPAGWSNQDIGAVSAAGRASFDGNMFTVSGSGADVWGTADAFHFAHKTMTGDFSITARVVTVQNVSQWTKAGLMIRESLSPNARHGFALATPSTVKGTAFQYRDPGGGTSASIAGPAFAPPVWLKLVKRGITITSYYRHSITDPWEKLNYQVYSGLADSVEAGLAVSSHVDGQIATATFSDVVVEALPPWQAFNIASPGGAADDGTIFATFGQGSDIWGTADALVGFFVPWVGDGTMTARVRSLENTSAWAKAGVMFRESLTPGAKHVYWLLSAGHGAALQYRASTDGQSAQAFNGPGSVPAWLRLTRRGDQFIAEMSVDGVAFSMLASTTLPMNQTLYVGIAHTSHNADARGNAVFDDLRITR
jgi:regulation of enolase protein 1 (concanavalin A-like superfamily)